MKPLPEKWGSLAEFDAYLAERRKTKPELTDAEGLAEVRKLTEPLSEEEDLKAQKLAEKPLNDWVKGYEQRTAMRSGLWGLLYVIVFAAIILWWVGGPGKCVP